MREHTHTRPELISPSEHVLIRVLPSLIKHGLLNSIQGRGSDNPNTGPIRDHSSFTSNRVTGAFAYIDASSPRRPNDVARIISEEFPATGPNSPLCLRFWTHMYGSGIGSLNVYIRHGADDTKVWGLSGDAGNNWYMAQAPIASSSPFKVQQLCLSRPS